MFNEFLIATKNKPGIFIDYNNSNITDLINPDRLIIFNLNPKTNLDDWKNANIKNLLDSMKIIIISVNTDNTENINPEEIRSFFQNTIYNKISCFIDNNIAFYFNSNIKTDLVYPLNNCNIKLE